MHFHWASLYGFAAAVVLGLGACHSTSGAPVPSSSPVVQPTNSVISQNSAPGNEPLPDLYDDQALKTYQEQLKLARDLKDRRLEGMALVGVGNVYAKQEKFSLALEHLEPGLKIVQEFGDRVSEKLALSNLITTYLNLGYLDKTTHVAQRLLTLAQQEQNLALQATALQGLGSAESSKRNYKEGIQHHQQALQLVRQINDPEQEAILLIALGETYLQVGELEKAEEYLEQSSVISTRGLQVEGKQDLTIKSTDTWGIVVAKAIKLRQQGRTEAAIAAFVQYGEMFTSTDPTAARYAQTAQQFTQQLSALGLEGGAYIFEVFEGDTASKVGLEVGDIIIEYNGQPIRGTNDFESVTKTAPKSERLPMAYLRLGENGQFRRLR